MLLQKFESAKWSAPFAKKKEDVNSGDIVTIVADAEEQPDSYNPGKTQTAIKVKTKAGDKMVSLNQTSINILISEFGTNDASQWIGKKAKVLLRGSVIGGKKTIALYLVGVDYTLDEFGSPVKEGTETQDMAAEEIPTIQLNEEKDEIKLEDVPF